MHVARNVQVYQDVRCSSVLRIRHPQSVLFQCILMSAAEAVNGLSALLLGILLLRSLQLGCKTLL